MRLRSSTPDAAAGAESKHIRLMRRQMYVCFALSGLASVVVRGTHSSHPPQPSTCCEGEPASEVRVQGLWLQFSHRMFSHNNRDCTGVFVFG